LGQSQRPVDCLLSIREGREHELTRKRKKLNTMKTHIPTSPFFQKHKSRFQNKIRVSTRRAVPPLAAYPLNAPNKRNPV
jgi:hypothetical protein